MIHINPINKNLIISMSENNNYLVLEFTKPHKIFSSFNPNTYQPFII